MAFDRKVGRYLAGRDPRLDAELRTTLTAWKDNHALVLPALAASPALREIEPLSLGLARACAAGLEALTVLEKGEGRPAAWAEERAKVLAEAAKPAAHAELAVLGPIAKLVQACTGETK